MREEVWRVPRRSEQEEGCHALREAVVLMPAWCVGVGAGERSVPQQVLLVMGAEGARQVGLSSCMPGWGTYAPR